MYPSRSLFLTRNPQWMDIWKITIWALVLIWDCWWRIDLGWYGVVSVYHFLFRASYVCLWDNYVFRYHADMENLLCSTSSCQMHYQSPISHLFFLELLISQTCVTFWNHILTKLRICLELGTLRWSTIFLMTQLGYFTCKWDHIFSRILMFLILYFLSVRSSCALFRLKFSLWLRRRLRCKVKLQKWEQCYPPALKPSNSRAKL